MKKEKLLSYQDLEIWLNVPRATLYSLVHRRAIPHHRLGGRLVRFEETRIQEWLDSDKVRTQKLVTK